MEGLGREREGLVLICAKKCAMTRALDQEDQECWRDPKGSA